MENKMISIASGLRKWNDDADNKFDHFEGNCADYLQQVRIRVNSNVDNYVPDMNPMQNGWSRTSHFTWDDTPLGTPTEDFCPPLDPSMQPVPQPNTCSSLQLPLMSTSTSATPPVQPIALPATTQQSLLSGLPQSSLAINQFKISTVSDTPTPSPSSNDEDCSASSPMSDKQSLSEYSEDLSLCKSKQEILNMIPKDVRVPQRKGNMQLWQFLYAILENQTDIIEWTANKSDYEFRLLQPDVVAIWWGHQKNRQNMNYDKLSRSLRYYYNRKIITKVNSERYVYRFCCNPELLYSVLGNSHTKPKLKEMPAEAKQILEWNHGMPGSRNVNSPMPQLLRAPSPSQVTSVNYIHPLKNEMSLPTTCSTNNTMPVPPNCYAMSKQPQSIDTSFMPPNYYYAPCDNYPMLPPPPCYQAYNPTPNIATTEWDHYPF